MKTSSTELAIPTTQQLCEQVIHYAGTNRGDDRRIRQDADWLHDDVDGEPLRLRLIQQRGIGSAALYTLRVEHIIDRQQSIYRYDPLIDSLRQLHAQPGGNTLFHEWPGNTIDHLLRDALANPQ